MIMMMEKQGIDLPGIGLGKYELEKLKEAFLVTDDHDKK